MYANGTLAWTKTPKSIFEKRIFFSLFPWIGLFHLMWWNCRIDMHCFCQNLYMHLKSLNNFDQKWKNQAWKVPPNCWEVSRCRLKFLISSGNAGPLNANSGWRFTSEWRFTSIRNMERTYTAQHSWKESSAWNFQKKVFTGSRSYIESGCVTDLCLPEFTSPPAPSSLPTHLFVMLSE